MYQQKIVPKIIDHKERNKECHIKKIENILERTIYRICW